jgi:hypothetical protein
MRHFVINLLLIRTKTETKLQTNTYSRGVIDELPQPADQAATEAAWRSPSPCPRYSSSLQT